MSRHGTQTGRRPWRALLRGLLAGCLLLLFVLALRSGLFRGISGGRLLPLPADTGGFALHMIDVGQGQALLLTCGGESAVIDTGPPSAAQSTADYVLDRGVGRLRYLFVTHPHSDHCGGAGTLLEQVGADTLVIPEYLSAEAALATAGDWVGRTGTQVAVTHTGEQFALGEAVITVLHPPLDNGIDDMNQLSLVLLVEYSGRRLLITGDISGEVEQSLLPLGHVDVLQVAHHGSGASSCLEFLEDLSPEHALISCGRNNDYGHPHAAVLERLEAVGARIWRTDEQGSIVVRIREGQITVETEYDS